MVPLNRSNFITCGSDGCCCTYDWPVSQWISQTHSRDHVQVIGFHTNPILPHDQSDGIYARIQEEVDFVMVNTKNSPTIITTNANLATGEVSLFNKIIVGTCGVNGYSFLSGCCLNSFNFVQNGNIMSFFPSNITCGGQTCLVFQGTSTSSGTATAYAYMSGTQYSSSSFTISKTSSTTIQLKSNAVLAVCHFDYNIVAGSTTGSTSFLTADNVVIDTTSDDSAGVIAGAVVGSLVAVAVAAVVIHRRRIENQKRVVNRVNSIVVAGRNMGGNDVDGVASENPNFFVKDQNNKV